MRRLFVAILIALSLATLFVWSINKDPGYVLIVWGSKTVEMSVWTAIILLLVVVTLLYITVRLWRNTWRFPRTISRWFSGRNLRVNHSRTTRGMIAFIEGHWRRARTLLVKVADGSDSKLLYYLMAARASHQLGESKETEYYLRRAAESTDGADIAVGLTQAEMQLVDGQLEQCLATLIRVSAVSAEHPVALKLLVAVHKGLADWQALYDLLPDLKRAQILSDDKLQALQVEVYCALFQQVSADENDIEKLWQKVPKPLRQTTPIIIAYVQRLLSNNEANKAANVLQSALKKNWDDQLVHFYGLAHSNDLRKQLQIAEGWLPQQQNNGALLLCLGRLSLANELWGKARDYFEASLSCQPSAEVYAELGRLMANLGEQQKSQLYFQRGLLHSVSALPQLPQPKTGNA